MMWVLLLVMTGLYPGTVPVLSYDTLEECTAEQDRLTMEFNKVYTERNYEFTCKQKGVI